MEYEIQTSFYPKAMLGNSGGICLIIEFLARRLSNNPEEALLALRARGEVLEMCSTS